MNFGLWKCTLCFASGDMCHDVFVTAASTILQPDRWSIVSPCLSLCLPPPPPGWPFMPSAPCTWRISRWMHTPVLWNLEAVSQSRWSQQTKKHFNIKLHGRTVVIVLCRCWVLFPGLEKLQRTQTALTTRNMIPGDNCQKKCFLLAT